MTLIPDRTVAGQLAVQLREEIAKGTWRGWLPGERALAQSLRASRNAVRSAVNHLKAEGLVESVRGQGNRVVAHPRLRSGAGTGAGKTIGLVAPLALGGLRPFIALWIDELKDLLYAVGYRLHVHDGRQYYQPNPARVLERLLTQHHHDAWVLTLSSEAMQRWFERRAVPCLVAGSLYAGVGLPCIDLDYRAICRHAAGVLLRRGHRHIALLNRESRRAGDIDSERGFLEGAQSATDPAISADVVYHRDDVDSVRTALRRLLERRETVTGIVVCNPHAYLAAASILAQRGLRIPQDISLISRNDDPFLRALAPAPARYVITTHAFAKKMSGTLLQLAQGSAVTRPRLHLLPKFSLGGSIAVLRADATAP
jgi:LacI family transcriptional regulator